MSREYRAIPKQIPRTETRFRRVVTEWPVPESIPILETLRECEPRAMGGQPPVVWDHAEGFQVYDPWGNCWVDWSSGVLVANVGHGRPEIIEAITRQANLKLLTNYCFPSEIRARLVSRLSSLFPEPHKKVFLLTTGSEAVECAIKLCRTHGQHVGGDNKNVIVSFSNAFHGRTLGSQQAGGIPALKSWIVNLDPGFVQVPFPDGFRNTDTSFEFFLKSLGDFGVAAENVAGVVMETYQGGSAAFAPVEYIQRLRAWCDQHNVLLVMDEVQAGFGRTGKLWGYEHYNVLPDLTTWGKGISSSLPIAAVIGRRDVMDLNPPGSMTSTHTGNPISCAAALASIEIVLSENLAARAETLGNLLHKRLRELQAKHPEIGVVAGRGLVAGVACVHPGTTEPDGDLAFDVVQRSIEKGILMFSPVGVGGGTVKISPPLVITQEALEDSLQGFAEAFADATDSRKLSEPNKE
jgi:4-aminobutyrate aminotransferase / (S)-3-amino-2-methylpropionate transaminase / 5-aminovalerate transaminase